MKTKYPIILAHGIILKDFKYFKAFGKIEKILRAEGFFMGKKNKIKKITDEL